MHHSILISLIGRTAVIAFAVGVVVGGGTGCAERPAWERAEARPIPTPETAGWESMTAEDRPRRWSGGVTTFAREHPGLPSAGLPLPRVSPDGRWVAFPDVDREAPRVPSDAWLTGRGLSDVSLWLRRVEDDGLARNLAYGHAAWPTWSPNGDRLFFISHDPETGCALVVHDLATQRSQRMAVGLQNMVTPAVSPDGRRVAVAGYGALADEAVLFVIDLETGQATPGPPPTLGGAQFGPRWLDDQTLLFVELDERGGGLMRWRRGESFAEPVAPLALPASIFDAVHLHAGIASPVSPNARRFAYYAAANDRIELVALSSADAAVLEPGDRAGAWWGEGWFIVADDDQLALVVPPEENEETVPELDAGASASKDSSTTPDPVEMPRMALLAGLWVPLWTDAANHSMILIGPGGTPERFALLQLWAVTR